MTAREHPIDITYSTQPGERTTQLLWDRSNTCWLLLAQLQTVAFPTPRMVDLPVPFALPDPSHWTGFPGNPG